MNGILWTFLGTLLTFSVTTLGAAGVFFVKKDMGGRLRRRRDGSRFRVVFVAAGD